MPDKVMVTGQWSLFQCFWNFLFSYVKCKATPSSPEVESMNVSHTIFLPPVVPVRAVAPQPGAVQPMRPWCRSLHWLRPGMLCPVLQSLWEVSAQNSCSLSLAHCLGHLASGPSAGFWLSR